MRPYPVLNADAVDNPDGSITFSFSIRDRDSDVQIAGPITVQTVPNPEMPDIERATYTAMGQYIRSANSLTRAGAYNALVSAHTVVEGWTKWGW